jgi:hypothetical protein
VGWWREKALIANGGDFRRDVRLLNPDDAFLNRSIGSENGIKFTRLSRRNNLGYLPIDIECGTAVSLIANWRKTQVINSVVPFRKEEYESTAPNMTL